MFKKSGVDKTQNYNLNSIFSVAGEMMKDNGEDCFYYDADGNEFIIASLDGCGGSGSKKYENYSGKTGAYIASRAVCGGVKAWFDESKEDARLTGYIKDALAVCGRYADKQGRIMGSLGKSFPTTAAIITGKINAGFAGITCLWAGDSRCYMLDANGLHQLTEDDLDGQDAMSNLTGDGVITNVISASADFEIHTRKIAVNTPCIFLTATDGCFGYFNSPMEFEYILTASLVRSQNIKSWKENLDAVMGKAAGDDYTLCAAILGFKDYNDIQKYFVGRNDYVEKTYIRSESDVNSLWNIYKRDYSEYLKK